MPSVVVETVRLELVDDARKVKIVVSEVVANLPFTVELSTPAAAVKVLELIVSKVVVVATPLTEEVKVIELVEVETESELTVDEATTPFKSTVVVATPLITETSDVPVAVREFELMIAADEVTPLTLDRSVLADEVRELVVVDCRSAKEVVATTPLMLVVRTPPE